MGPLVDRFLVFKAKQGDRDAFGRIYQKYGDCLFVLAVALSNDKTIAEDAVQDTFVYFAEHLDDFTLTGTLKGYLATCVSNRVRYYLRSKRRQFLNTEQAELIQAESCDPSEDFILSEQLKRLAFFLTELPTEQREVVMLYSQGAMSFRAIAQSLGIPPDTAKSRYRYGIHKLKSLLKCEAEK